MRALAGLLLVALLSLAGCGTTKTGAGAGVPPRLDPQEDVGAPIASAGTAPLPLALRLDGTPDPVRLRFKRPPAAGLLFDLDTGRVLWRREPTRVLPIASLTKLMTAILVTETLGPTDRVTILPEALRYEGQAIGLLRRGQRVRTEALLAGVLLTSANDASRALAFHIAGGIPQFAARMNALAKRLGMTCSRFVSPDGYARGNHSCPTDLAILARAALRIPRIARLARLRQVDYPFPIAGGRVYLSSHNPLLLRRFRGATGLKTGYTEPAGRCLIGTAQRGRVRLGVVLLDSPDTGGQAEKLLERGFGVS